MASTQDVQIGFGSVSLDLLDRVEKLEAIGFPADEAASRETMAFRLQNASDFFVGTYLLPKRSDGTHLTVKEAQESSENLIGYVVGTCCFTERLEHESMFKHDPSGNHLCIHSVLTDEKYQGRGFAKQSLNHYIQHIKNDTPQVAKISLLTKASKMRLYESVGFTFLGVSPVVHGQEEWNELYMTQERA